MYNLLNDKLGAAEEKLRAQRQAEQSFAMSAHYALRHTQPAITAGDEDIAIVYPGEICTLVALPGAGKTQVCEALASAWLADYHQLEGIDTLGFDVMSTQGKSCLYLDTERPHDDNFKSYSRILRRIGSYRDDRLLDAEGRVVGLDYRCAVGLDSVALLLEEIERLCEGNAYGLIIIDGALDLVASMNNEEECNAAVKWLRALAHKMDCPICTTLHPNKGGDTMAGHLGAMLYRYSRACLSIRPHEQNGDIKIITSEFSQGKLSHGKGSLAIPFGWDNEQRIMVSLPAEEAENKLPEKIRVHDFELVFNSFLIGGKTWVPANEIKKEYIQRTRKSEQMAKKHITYAISKGWIEKRGETKATEYRWVGE